VDACATTTTKTKLPKVRAEMKSIGIRTLTPVAYAENFMGVSFSGIGWSLFVFGVRSL